MTARVLFVGWDGADWAVLDRLQSEGLLPALSAVRAGGTEGTLRSTFPPHSVAAWTSFLTGRPAGSHGIVDFMRCRPGAVFPDVPYTGDDLPGPTLLEILSGAGRRVLCANVPMTFPPRPVNGLLVGGVFLPDGARFTHPPELQDRLDELGGFPVNGMGWHRAPNLAELFAEAAEVTARQTRVFVELLRQERWDVALLAYMAPDRVQHAAMHLLDPAHPAYGQGDERHRELLAGVFRELDRGLEALLSEAGADRVVLASDHGFRPVWRDVVPNRLLEELGHLRFRAVTSRVRRALAPAERVARLASGSALGTRLARSGTRARGARASAGSVLAARARRSLGAEARIDWARTVAYAPSGVCSGIRLNVAGRDPRGVLPASRFDDTLARLVADLREAADRGGRRYFDAVAPVAELAPGLVDRPGAPDLFYVPGEGLGVATQGSGPVRPAGRKTGEHRVEGIVLRAGGGSVPGSIWDVPRLLAGLAGVEDAAWDARPDGRAAALTLSADEETSIVEHLQGLGYVD